MNAIMPSSPVTAAAVAELDAAVARSVSAALSETEAAVLWLSFGLDGTPRSLTVVAHRLRLRPTAVLRLQRRAMRALRRAALADAEGDLA